MAIEAQVALVHGGGIRLVEDGGFALRPGSISRANMGVALYHIGAVERLLFTGGNAFGHNYSASEAGLMADLAMSHGVPASAIDAETDSTSTIGNWANSLPMIQATDAETILGVTGRIATSRAAMIGERLISSEGCEVSLMGYRASGENEGFRAHPREMVSKWMARRCLDSAEAAGVSLSDLDTYYLGWKSRTGLAHAKLHLTRR